MAGFRKAGLFLVIAALSGLAACSQEGGFSLLGGKKSQEGAETSGRGTETGAVRIVERDVEAPEIFQVTEDGLWDGRPSLGGVWVAHPDVKEPQRVIIRNEANGQFVIGALFRREREAPGPALQVSSDAAAALGMLAGSPTRLNVTALRRQEVPIAEETGVEPADPQDPAAGAVETTELAGGEDGEGAATASTSIAAEARASAPARPGPATSALDKPYIQVGLFSVEENARKLAESLRAQGIIPLIRAGSTQGKSYWRVLVGPASSRSERAALLKKVKALGFADAYFVKS
ncbi:Sporulation related domain-containing protein [Meinhardsimonia xiamenensis]|jgi:cell division septation protein DedD|uniref:Sporulation related domain-containing protein n=1 Tax=Meinhardsimonia xiamenensis TaxID=990712 RepID=A0A1G9ADP6_9RHOB|nr:SPOR domain-containing protein [Meinhardsimonia xiamenensis]PRX35426.1 sporulation related protein [Meinhardsimonia xiamenensis]SDK25487.1 Sporulation related domain-containing protein [Meinhardsimonia xiamenensis]